MVQLEEIMLKVKDKLCDGTFRNQSPIFEYAVRNLLGGIKNE